MSTSTVSPDGAAPTRRESARAVSGGAAPVPGRYAVNDAANDAPASRPALLRVAEHAVRPRVPNLSISSWYAISGTAMA